MARTRSIKPEFFDDEKLATVSRDARLLFIGLWKCSDDYSVTKGHPVWIKSQVFPYDDDVDISKMNIWLKELENIYSIFGYRISGEKYYYIRTFTRHQKIDRPSKMRNPAPPIDQLNAFIKKAESLGSEDNTRGLLPRVHRVSIECPSSVHRESIECPSSVHRESIDETETETETEIKKRAASGVRGGGEGTFKVIDCEGGGTAEDVPKGPEATFIELVAAATKNKPTYKVTMSYRSKLQKNYPRIDVDQQLRNMAGWLVAGQEIKKKQKTLKGMPAFITNWLNRRADQIEGGSKDGDQKTHVSENPRLDDRSDIARLTCQECGGFREHKKSCSEYVAIGDVNGFVRKIAGKIGGGDAELRSTDENNKKTRKTGGENQGSDIPFDFKKQLLAEGKTEAEADEILERYKNILTKQGQ